MSIREAESRHIEALLGLCHHYLSIAGARHQPLDREHVADASEAEACEDDTPGCATTQPMKSSRYLATTIGTPIRPGHGGDMHAEHMRMMHGIAGTGPTMPGQDAFGAIAEIVRILEADPATDWSKVDLERLRQHLIDMNEVMLHSVVKQTPIVGGLAMEISGSGRTEQAIRAMVVPHAAELDRMPEWSATTVVIPDGVRLTVVAKRPDDTKLLARIRGLGFAGLMTQGGHHQPHHLAMAKGEALGGHGH